MFSGVSGMISAVAGAVGAPVLHMLASFATGSAPSPDVKVLEEQVEDAVPLAPLQEREPITPAKNSAHSTPE